MRSLLCSAKWSKLPSGALLLFLFSSTGFLLHRCEWATISVSQLLCLFVGWKDNDAVFLNAQVVSLPFPFSHSPPLPHLSTLSLTSHSPQLLTCTLYSSQCLSLISFPTILSLPFFTPLSGFISLTSCPLSLSPFLSFAGLQTAERLSTKASYSSPRTAPSITPDRPFPPIHRKDAHTYTHIHMHLLGSALKNWHTCASQISKQSTAKEQCANYQLILILWLCTIQYFLLHGY